MRAFVTEHLIYPAAAREARVEGMVVVRYSLDYRGKVVATKVKKGIGYGCDEEAMRVVRLMRFLVPQERKKKVRIHQDVNIHFRLAKVKPAAVPEVRPATAMQITYTTVEKTDANKCRPESGGYGYTISW